MNKEQKKTRTPKLRFAEFREAGEWEVKQLSDVLIFQTGCPFDSAGFNESKGIRLVRNRDLKSDDKIIYYNQTFDEKFLVNNGDILVGMDGDFNPCLWSKGKALLNQRVGRVFAKKENSQNFFYYFLAIHLKKIEENTARTTVKHLSHSDIEKINEPLPPFPEQQKITAFLSSLDDLISAQSEKIKTLQAHKKGLMQQLFPAEGGTTPRVRFGEFEGDWEEKLLGEVAKYENGKAHEQDISETGDFVVVNSKFISTDGEVRKYTNTPFCVAKKGEILMVLSDVPNGRAIAKCFIVDDGNLYTVNQRICKLTPTKADGVMLFYSLNRNPYFLAFDDGVKQTNLKKDDVLDCPLLLPKDPKEQQKIAACLSSLDNLIAAQSQKLEALKAQKKGLMQGLFPNPE